MKPALMALVVLAGAIGLLSAQQAPVPQPREAPKPGRVRPRKGTTKKGTGTPSKKATGKPGEAALLHPVR